jgi:hypothetical protein
MRGRGKSFHPYQIQGAAPLALLPGAVRQSVTHVAGLKCYPCLRSLRSLYTLERLFEAGTRWEGSPAEKIGNVRRALLRLSDSSFIEAMKLLAMDSYCSPEILRELARTRSMRVRMSKVGFIQSPVDQYQRFERIRPTQSREVLAKCGIEVPKPEPRLSYSVQIGDSRSTGREIRLSRV